MNRLFLTLALASLPTSLPTFLPASLHAETSYHLKPFEQQADQVLDIRISSRSSEGRMIVNSEGEKSEGALSMQRSRNLERRVVSQGGAKGLSYKILEDIAVSSNELEGPNSQTRHVAALTGQTVVGLRDNFGQWQFYMEGSTADNRQVDELYELQAYENRRWFVDYPVKIGESWPINPAFFRHLLLRDLGKAQLKASMTLEDVKDVDGTRTAILSFKLDTIEVRDKGAAQSEASASISATGKLHFSLDTMLDREMVFSGLLKTSARNGDHQTSVILPFTIRSTKTIKPSN